MCLFPGEKAIFKFQYVGEHVQKIIAPNQPHGYCPCMKLCQGQVWKQGKEYIRIVRLERLEVEYKSMPNLARKEGTMHITSKKDFCRLLKQARLLPPGKAANPVGLQRFSESA